MQSEAIVLISDPRVLAMPIIDNQEPMINLVDQTALRYGPSPEIANNTDYTKMRKSVYEKLLILQERLPNGIDVCLYEAYRSLALQQLLFDERMALLNEKHIDWSKEALFIECTKMVSPVINWDGSQNIPPHSTGGAIDIYLVDEKGRALDMGIHPRDWMQDVDGVLSPTNSPLISDTARHNRLLLSQLLTELDFVNYPTEYWHWSYGDRYWAYVKNATHAIYGSKER